MQILIISDTHIDNGDLTSLPSEVIEQAQKADIVIHAGDFTSPEMLECLSNISSSFYGVYGNHDHSSIRKHLPQVQQIESEGQKITLVHGDEWGRPRPSRLWREFHNQADLVVYGHLHLPLIVTFDGGHVVNPGSVNHPRSSRPSYAWGNYMADQNKWDIEIKYLR